MRTHFQGPFRGPVLPVPLKFQLDGHALVHWAVPPERLKRHLPRYKKGSALFPDPLLPLTRAAIDRARRLDERARQEDAPGLPNPSTSVPALVEHLFAIGGAS